jgi:hypothetical protein
MTYDMTTNWRHVFAKHADDCPARDGGACTCGPLGYRAVVEDPATRRRVPSPLLADADAARVWYQEQRAAVEAAEAAAHGDQIAALADEMVELAADGRELNLRGQQYSPAGLRELRTGLTRHVVPQLGSLRIQDLRAQHVQEFADRLVADGLSRQRTGSVVNALRALCAFAVRRGLIERNPADLLVLPAEAAPSRATATGAFTTGWQDQDRNRSTTGTWAPTTTPTPTNDGLIAEAASLPDRAIWWCLKVIVLVFVLIILVLIAESI